MESISELAARWAVRADAGPLSPDETRELDSWLNSDPRHRGAYVRARAQWVDLDRLAALHGPAHAADTIPAEANPQIALPGASNAALQQAVPSSSGLPSPPSTLTPIATPTRTPSAGSSPIVSRRQLLAASVAAVTVISGGLSWIILRRGREHYTSGIGEVRRIALEDGSTVLLNTATEVAVEFNERERNVQLIRGEALFEVAHETARPFLVRVNDIAVRAVGTAFAVRLEAAQVDVTVTEGIVEVAEPATALGSDQAASAASRPKAQRVAANERVVIRLARAPELRPIAPAEADRQLAWREGLVSFDGESLQTAVAEINRHNRRQIVIDDPALAEKPVVGIFRATDLDGFSAAAAEALKARAVHDGDVIHLQPGAAQTLN